MNKRESALAKKIAYLEREKSQLIEALALEREKACYLELQAVLDKHHCSFEVADGGKVILRFNTAKIWPQQS